MRVQGDNLHKVHITLPHTVSKRQHHEFPFSLQSLNVSRHTCHLVPLASSPSVPARPVVWESQSLPPFLLIPGGLLSGPHILLWSLPHPESSWMEASPTLLVCIKHPRTGGEFTHWVDLTDNLGGTGKAFTPERPRSHCVSLTEWPSNSGLQQDHLEGG